ncbi:MAG: redoxin domain-containing protein [Muribaculaceae bacterium]|nr:redoxin domain-containing protein [Muribaculaceae bacterium]
MIAAAFLTSAISVEKKLEVGNTAPIIETMAGTTLQEEISAGGKRMLISFWNPKKPSSRIANKQLGEDYSDDENVEFISICTDSDESLMHEVMKIDGVKSDKAYSYSQISSRVFKDYGVENSPCAFMISENGKITEIKPI